MANPRCQKTVSLPRKLLEEIEEEVKPKGLTVTGYIRTVLENELAKEVSAS